MSCYATAAEMLAYFGETIIDEKTKDVSGGDSAKATLALTYASGELDDALTTAGYSALSSASDGVKLKIMGEAFFLLFGICNLRDAPEYWEKIHNEFKDWLKDIASGDVLVSGATADTSSVAIQYYLTQSDMDQTDGKGDSTYNDQASFVIGKCNSSDS